MAVANALVFNYTGTITDVKRFLVHGQNNT